LFFQRFRNFYKMEIFNPAAVALIYLFDELLLPQKEKHPNNRLPTGIKKSIWITCP